MSAKVVIPIVEARSRSAVLVEVLGEIRRRLGWKALGALCALMALSQGLTWVEQLPFILRAQVESRPPEFWLSTLVIEAVCNGCLVLGIIVADVFVDRGAPRFQTYATSVIVAAGLGGWLQWETRAALGLRVMTSMPDVPREVTITQPFVVGLGCLIGGMIVTFVHVNRRTALAARQRMLGAELERARTRRRTLESKLQAMQARVEPQFLFNTLAQVRELLTSDPVGAGRMLDDLIAYLRAALPHLRESTSTLGKELELARAYLDIVRMRLGDRLKVDIRIPEALCGARMPPMMLLPLIDHALVYGIEANRTGGSISIETRAEAGRLHLTITDSGAGFVSHGGAQGLRSIEERLHALYGSDGRLALARRDAGSTQASMEIPYEPIDGSHR